MGSTKGHGAAAVGVDEQDQSHDQNPTAPHLRGPWPDGRPLLRREVAAYLADVADGSIDHLPTRCAPWTVADVTAHLAVSLLRFNAMIDQSRNGDLSPPFAPELIDEENLEAVAMFDGDPVQALADEAEGLLERTTDLLEPVPHQIGVMPAGLQILFGLLDVCMHHDDVLDAAGRRYAVPEEVVVVARPVAFNLFGVSSDEVDLATALIVGSGRPKL